MLNVVLIKKNKKKKEIYGFKLNCFTSPLFDDRAEITP